jgi:hypothetical protein
MAQHPAHGSSTAGYSFRVVRDGVTEIWAVAIDDKKDAEAKLRKELGSYLQILSFDELTKAKVAELALEPGQAKKSSWQTRPFTPRFFDAASGGPGTRSGIARPSSFQAWLLWLWARSTPPHSWLAENHDVRRRLAILAPQSVQDRSCNNGSGNRHPILEMDAENCEFLRQPFPHNGLLKSYFHAHCNGLSSCWGGQWKTHTSAGSAR